ncbi:hypothetical protein TKK_0010226 [Trichogramma kaykai]|uniref:Mutator-like transposase domain-containing protein n=1 Tax=Trichogramma kaykai TaxID=54128 RepID=A0ABD2WYW8_9HYME
MEPACKLRRGNPGRKGSIGRKRNLVFKGNRYTPAPQNKKNIDAKARSSFEAAQLVKSASKSKLSSNQFHCEVSPAQYRLVDLSLLLPFLQKNLFCQCGTKFVFDETSIRGFGFELKFECTNKKCQFSSSVLSSKLVGPKKNIYEVNRRSVLASRTAGLGLTGLQTICGMMDLPQPVTQLTYQIINENLEIAAKKVATKSMQQAVAEESQRTPKNDPGLSVSGDGTWRTPGFTSLQGAASLIGHHTGKVIDIITKNKFCQACRRWENKNKDSAEYLEWFEVHKEKCKVNHTGSSGLMEVDGIVEMFKRATTVNKVMYKNYIGDGDCKVYAKIKQVKPFGESFIVEKKEDINHVGKRMGTRLRNKKKDCGKNVLSDVKTIGGRGRLTAVAIDQLSSYYTLAIRRNTTVTGMYNDIWATFFHKRSTDANPQHHLCPPGAQSWCKWLKALAQSTLNKFIHKSSIPPAIMDYIKNIYEDLSKTELLEKCVGAYSQNANEFLNHLLWKYVPKKQWSGGTILNIGAFIAVSTFNDGKIYQAEVQKTMSSKETRSANLKRKHNYPDDDSYVPGGH